MLRVFHHYISGRKLWFFLAEGATIAAASLGGASAAALVFAPVGSAQLSAGRAGLWAAFTAVLGFQFALYLLDLYNLRVAQEDRQRGLRLLKGAGCAVVVLAVASALLRLHFPPGAVWGWAVGAMAGVWVSRWAFPALVGQPVRILLVGDGNRARELLRVVGEEGENAFGVVAQVSPADLLSHPGALSVRARAHQADVVVLALDEARGILDRHTLLNCRFSGFRLYEAHHFVEQVLRRIPVSSPRLSDLLFGDGLALSGFRTGASRALDVAVASLLFFIFWPVMAAVALAIRLDSKGPILYQQERAGLWGQPFFLWKFRSMRVDAEKDGAVWAKQNDDRITRVGRIIRKTRMDELPQLFNVLRGEMALVGPRPERPVFVSELKEKIPLYGLREAVKPGLTGWAQIRYPYGASVEDARNKLEFDLYYIKNGTLFLDLACLFHTVRHVLVGRGAR